MAAEPQAGSLTAMNLYGLGRGNAPASSSATPMDTDSAGARTSAGQGAWSNGASAVITLRPFALVDEVSGGSPAAAAGLEVGGSETTRWRSWGIECAAVAGMGWRAGGG
jgi:hypothetical protein